MTTENDTTKRRGSAGDLALRRMAVAWFLSAAAGQIAFVLMIVVHYAYKTVTGNLPGWNDKPLIKGYVAGDTAGNTMFAIHVLLAAVMTLGGLGQLVPAFRMRAPWLHRWNGRLFFVLAIVIALGGLWLTIVRRTYLSVISGIAVSVDGILILVFAIIAWQHAVGRRFAEHRRWAIRTFMVVSGVWFLRVGIMAWAITTGGLGMNRAMSGPANIILGFGCYLIPLAITETYFRALGSRRATTKRLVAGLIAIATVVTALGIFGTIAVMWLPYIL